MTAKEAIAIFKSRCPDFKVTGYWEDGDKIIVNTAPLYNKEAEEVCQYIVFSNGVIQGTNPLRNEVIIDQPMHLIAD